MPAHTYCATHFDRGLTCPPAHLALLRRLSDYRSATHTSRILLYQCSVCQGLYKYMYSSSYQTRNFDAEEGWAVDSDYYYKVGERNGAGSVQFPLNEARIYGYREDATMPALLLRCYSPLV